MIAAYETIFLFAYGPDVPRQAAFAGAMQRQVQVASRAGTPVICRRIGSLDKVRAGLMTAGSWRATLDRMYDIAQPYGPLVESTLRLVTWNVWGRHGPWEPRERAITETLRALDPDIVVLTEAWQAAEDSQCARLGPELGLPHHAFTAPASAPSPDGVAVLARWPIARQIGQELDSAGLATPLLFLEIDGPRGPVQVFATGLNDFRPDQSAQRQAHVHSIAELVSSRQNKRAPTIVAGDFNADPDSDEIRMLTGRCAVPVPGLVFHDAWEMAGDPRESGATWSRDNAWAAPALWPSRRIDYIFTAWPRRGGLGHPVHCELVGTTPIDGVLPSDHYGVLADLRY